MVPIHYAKLKPPRAGCVIERLRLFDELDHMRSHPIIWVPAPAGAGKTTLLASYIQNHKVPCLWYQFDPSDNDPAAFFQCLTKAAQDLTQSGDPLPSFSPAHYPALPVFAQNFFEAMSRILPRPCCLVFDDYHELYTDSSLHTVFRYGLAIMPRELNTFFLSRTEPPPALVRMQVTGALKRLPGKRLQLTREEAYQMAAAICDKKLDEDPKKIQKLHARTEGWAAGFVLCLIQSEDSPSEGHLSRELQFDFFIGEVLEHLDPLDQEFLKKTAVFPEFTARMAQELTGNPHAERILSSLVSNNHFTLLQGDDEAIYRYHALFRECLVEHALRSHGKGGLSAIRQKAADILLLAEATEEAFELLAKAEFWKKSADLVRSHGPKLVEQGRHATLERWLSRLPAELLARDPWLLFWFGTAQMPLKGPQAALCYFEKAFAGFEKFEDVNGLFLAWCGVVESTIFNFGDFRPLNRWIEVLHRLCNLHSLPQDPMIAARVILNMLSALCFCRPEANELEPWETRAQHLLRTCPPGIFRLCLVRQLIHLAAWKGDCAGVSALLEEIEPDEVLFHQSPLEMTYYLTFTVMGPWLLGDFEKAMDSVERGLATAEQCGLKEMLTPLLGHGVFTALSSGDLAGANSMLGRMKPLVSPERSLDYAQYHFLQAWRKTLARQPGSEHHLTMACKVGLESGTPYPQAVNALAMAALCLEECRFDEVAEHLQPAEDLASRMPSTYLAIKCGLTRAELAMFQKDFPEADRHLQKAFNLMRETGLVNFDFWRPQAMGLLCARAVEADIEQDFVRQLIRRRHIVPPQNLRNVETWPWPVKIYTLGRFSLVINGNPLRFERKGQKRPLQLLQAIVALGGRGINQMQLEDALWPEAPVGTAAKNFNTTLYRLRKLIGMEALCLEDGRVSLNARFCWVDHWAYECLLGQMTEALRQGSAEEITRFSDRAFALIQGPFLDREAEEPWMLSLREKLRRRTVSVFSRAGRHFGANGRCEKSIEILQRLIDIDPFAEEYHRRLMGCYAARDRLPEALVTYKKYGELLNRTFQTRPSLKTEALHQDILQGNPVSTSTICAACKKSTA